MTAVSDSLQRRTKKSHVTSTERTYLSVCFSRKPVSATETRNYFRYSKPAILSCLGTATDTDTHTSTGAEICICFNTTRGCTKGEACKLKHICNKRGWMQQLKPPALSPATKRAYTTGSKCYKAFCRKYSVTPFPTTQLTLCYFAAYISKQVQHATYSQTLHSSTTSRRIEPRLGGPTQGYPAVVMAPAWCSKTVQDQNQAANPPKAAAAADPVNPEQ